jgi:23S rRNA pseudouridine2605 synthase
MSSEGGERLRINQFLARSGVASRRGSEALVLEGRVTLNGEVVRELATSVDPGRDAVKVDGRRVHLPAAAAYFALYKPREVVSTLEDPEGRPCITAYLPKGPRGLFPVGRLDYHSEGLVLLTSDGELANRLLHPRFKVVKTYQVKVKGEPSQEALDRLRRGVVLDGRRTQPVFIRHIPSRETRHTWVEVEMTEGRKNQLREMFFRIEHPVIKLKRVAMGPIRLGRLRPGEVRPLTPEEVEELLVHAGLKAGAPEPPRKPERPRVWRGPSGKDATKDRKAGGGAKVSRPPSKRGGGGPAHDKREGGRPAPARDRGERGDAKRGARPAKTRERGGRGPRRTP